LSRQLTGYRKIFDDKHCLEKFKNDGLTDLTPVRGFFFRERHGS
jgi:hypothetical protein